MCVATMHSLSVDVEFVSQTSSVHLHRLISLLLAWRFYYPYMHDYLAVERVPKQKG